MAYISSQLDFLPNGPALFNCQPPWRYLPSTSYLITLDKDWELNEQTILDDIDTMNYTKSNKKEQKQV